MKEGFQFGCIVMTWIIVLFLIFPRVLMIQKDIKVIREFVDIQGSR